MSGNPSPTWRHASENARDVLIDITGVLGPSHPLATDVSLAIFKLNVALDAIAIRAGSTWHFEDLSQIEVRPPPESRR
jgi:hypothetical protein